MGESVKSAEARRWDLFYDSGGGPMEGFQQGVIKI